MQGPKDKELKKKTEPKSTIPEKESHLGSADAFEETENPLSRDADNISDEKLDELLED
jgi:hypothetical protein